MNSLPPNFSGCSREERELLLRLLLEQERRIKTGIKTPSKAALACPVVFAAEVFGIEAWQGQADLLRAAATHKRVTATSGHKTGKSTSFAILAWWWTADPSTRPQTRVALTSATARQIKKILWREIRALYDRAKARGYNLGPPPPLDPETGVQWPDGREIFGFTAQDPEKAAGISGANLYFLLDEASGILPGIFEALEGNRAGGASIVMVSNPTQQSGEFYDSHHTKRHLYKCLRLSSADAAVLAPNLPGLAKQSWIDEKRAEWGEDSPLYAVRVLGNFPEQASNAVMGLGLVTRAVTHKEDLLSKDVDEGSLVVGLDVARFGGDETVAAFRYGDRITKLVSIQGGDSMDTALRVVEAMKGCPDGTPVIVDSNGIGAGVYDALRRMPSVRAVACNTASAATKRNAYINTRAELHFLMAEWLKLGGRIPNDDKLVQDLIAPTYDCDAMNRIRVESKDDIRKKIKRSPDRGDACLLTFYSSAALTNDPGIFNAVPTPKGYSINYASTGSDGWDEDQDGDE